MNVLLGITGSVAAYKAYSVIRKLKEHAHDVEVILTKDSLNFVSPLILRTFLQKEPHLDFFDYHEEQPVHLKLATGADVFVIAPVSANTITKINLGFADNLLTTAWMIYRGARMLFPAMNENMYENPVIQKHIAELKRRDVIVFEPARGVFASYAEGKGRFPEPATVADEIEHYKFHSHMLKGRRLLVTTGATREYLDPVRCITNDSTGKMGVELAKCAHRAGADVLLIASDTSCDIPSYLDTIRVKDTEKMLKAVVDNLNKGDVFVSVAGVSDFVIDKKKKNKIKKNKSRSLNLKLVRNTDIIKSVRKKFGDSVKIAGFAAETEKVLENAVEKSTEKGMDLMVANCIKNGKYGFGGLNTKGYIIKGRKKITAFVDLPKDELAFKICESIARYL